MRNSNDESTKFVVLGKSQDHETAISNRRFRPIESLRTLYERGMFTGASRYLAVHLHCLRRDVARGALVLDLAGSALLRVGRQWRPLCRMSLALVRIG